VETLAEVDGEIARDDFGSSSLHYKLRTIQVVSRENVIIMVETALEKSKSRKLFARTSNMRQLAHFSLGIIFSLFSGSTLFLKDIFIKFPKEYPASFSCLQM